MSAKAAPLAEPARRSITIANGALVALCVLCSSAAAAALVGLLANPTRVRAHDAIDPGLPAVGSLLIHNAAVVLAPLALMALGWDREPVVRSLGDAVVLGSLLANGGVVGYAFARAGLALASYLPHLPFEWAALAIPAGAWYAVRRGPTGDRRQVLSRALLTSAIALATAAVLEVYAVPVA